MINEWLINFVFVLFYLFNWFVLNLFYNVIIILIILLICKICFSRRLHDLSNLSTNLSSINVCVISFQFSIDIPLEARFFSRPTRNVFLGSLEDDAFNAIGLLNVDLKIMFSYSEKVFSPCIMLVCTCVSNCSILVSSIILYCSRRLRDD